MQKASENPPPLSFGLLFIGQPKSGKTSLSVQFPNAYLIDCDDNAAGPTRYLQDKKLPVEFSYDVVNRDKGIVIPEEKRWGRLQDLTKEGLLSESIDTIIIDSLTSIADYLMAHILFTEKQKTMRIQDWIPFSNMTKRYITWIRSTGKLLIVTAHMSLEKDELDGSVKYLVNVPSAKLRDCIGGLFTDVWSAECISKLNGSEHEYKIRTMSTQKMSLGNSLGLPPVMDMDYKSIAIAMEKLSGKK